MYKVLLRSKNTELYIYYHRFFAIELFYGLIGNTILLSVQNIDELKLRSIIIYPYPIVDNMFRTFALPA